MECGAVMAKLITKELELSEHERDILSELEATYCGAQLMDDMSAAIRVARAIAAFRSSITVGEDKVFSGEFLEEWYGA